MELSLLLGLGATLIVGVLIGLFLDVDTFAGGLFSKLTKGKDPHRED
jgi:uncharacterized protein YneF (UPF0154 family)